MSHSVRVKINTNNISKEGDTPVYIVLTVNSKRKYFPTGLNTKLSDFDKSTGAFTGPRGDKERKNAILRKKITEIDNAIFDIMERNIPLSINAVQERIKGASVENFIHFAKKRIWEDRKLIAFKTFQQYNYAIGLTEKYSPDLTFAELDKKWLTVFRNYLKMKNYKANTILKIISALRKYTKVAFAEGFIKEDPFLNFKVGTIEAVDIQYCDAEELKRLEELLKTPLPSPLKNTLVHFLHSCYTGLRAVDQRRFNPDEHVKNGFIFMMMQKTKIEVRVPLNHLAKGLHPFIKQKLKQSHSRIADDLAELMSMAKIEKHITFHCARHTFAINSLVKGVPLEVVSKWLGHTSIGTTQTYAKVVDSLSASEMQKWNLQSEEFLKVTIDQENGIYKANVLIDGQEVSFPVEQKNKQLLKKELLKKLSDWFS